LSPLDLAYKQFEDNLVRVRNLVLIHNSLKTLITATLDLSDILRSAWVMLVAALDQYIHEVVRLGMLEIQSGQRPETEFFSKFSITMGQSYNFRTFAQGLANAGM